MDLNHRSWLKKCRVCNKEGSRNIFEKLTRTLESTSLQSVSSVDRLLEKLRFVTMMKIDEFDNKPQMLCDLCIIQLNVAYQFKTLAVEIDAKHQQFIIENGVHVSPNSENSTLQCIEQRTLERSSTAMRPLTYPVSLSSLQHRRLIKSEPTDYEIMSDITIDTNTDLVEDVSRNGVNSSASNQHFGNSNMVCVSDLDLLRSNGDSDIEFINNCLQQPSMTFRHFENPTNTVEAHQSTTTTTTTIASQLVIATSKPMNKNSNVKSDRPKSPSAGNKLGSPVNRIPKKRVKTKINSTDNELKKTLRPKSNENVNYSLVKRRDRKLINPVNKVRQMIKEEKESIKQSPGNKSPQEEAVNSDRKVNAKSASSILKKKRKKLFTEQKKVVHFPRGHRAPSKGQYREKLSLGRQITINDTDRFRFAEIKTINSVTATRN